MKVGGVVKEDIHIRKYLNVYLVIQSNHRLFGKYEPTELQKLHGYQPKHVRTYG